MLLHKMAFGLATGLLAGLSILLGTWALLLQITPENVESRISWILLGYNYTWGGAVYGFLWLFVLGFFAGVIFAWIYNKFSRILYKSKSNI